MIDFIDFIPESIGPTGASVPLSVFRSGVSSGLGSFSSGVFGHALPSKQKLKTQNICFIQNPISETTVAHWGVRVLFAAFKCCGQGEAAGLMRLCVGF